MGEETRKMARLWGLVAGVMIVLYTLLCVCAADNVQASLEDRCSGDCAIAKTQKTTRKKLYVCWYSKKGSTVEDNQGTYGWSESKHAAKIAARNLCERVYKKCDFDYCETREK